MGAYTSWAMLALTHHVIVQIAAMRAGLDKFGDYAVLGDDIVIANQAVARSYQYIMKTLGVEINMTKSLVSSKGVFEMAKRLCSPDQDFTPIGAKLLARGLKHPGELLNILRDMVSKSFNFARIDVKGYLYGKDTYFNRISESKKKDLL